METGAEPLIAAALARTGSAQPVPADAVDLCLEAITALRSAWPVATRSWPDQHRYYALRLRIEIALREFARAGGRHAGENGLDRSLSRVVSSPLHTGGLRCSSC